MALINVLRARAVPPLPFVPLAPAAEPEAVGRPMIQQRVGDLLEISYEGRYFYAVVLTPRVKLGVLRLGAEWERFSFGMPKHAPLPDTL